MIAVADHPVERRPVVGTLLSQLHEVADMVGRQVRPEVDHELTERRHDDRLFGRHLLGGQRRLERNGRPLPCLRMEGRQRQDQAQQ
jgi:hypothetical protein